MVTFCTFNVQVQVVCSSKAEKLGQFLLYTSTRDAFCKGANFQLSRR